MNIKDALMILLKYYNVSKKRRKPILMTTYSEQNRVVD